MLVMWQRDKILLYVSEAIRLDLTFFSIRPKAYLNHSFTIYLSLWSPHPNLSVVVIMDPISALSIATAVLDFLEFAGTLISTVNEIRHSSEGAALETLKLEDICQKLNLLSERLIPPNRPEDGPLSTLRPVRASEDVLALKELSVTCQEDCNEILEILKKLKVQGQSQRLWKSVKVALKYKSEQSKISEIKARLAQTQMAISLHVEAILR
jgi:hypothetical protein